MKKITRLTSWITSKKNYPYLFFLVLGLIIGTYKYSFTATLIGFVIVIAIGLIAGFIINKQIEK
jgi:hypothetical protein